MRTRLFIALLPLVAASLTACSGGSYTTADGLLAGAHNQLEQNDTAMASKWLASAALEVKTQGELKEYDLLQVEAELRSGRIDQARAISDRLLASYPRDPRVNEVAGKTRLMQGLYGDAAGHFEIALTDYQRESDRSRAADLLILARGFESYAAGRLAAAEETWATIVDDRLRATVVGAVNRTAAGSDVLARN